MVHRQVAGERRERGQGAVATAQQSDERASRQEEREAGVERVSTERRLPRVLGEVRGHGREVRHRRQRPRGKKVQRWPENGQKQNLAFPRVLFIAYWLSLSKWLQLVTCSTQILL